MFSGTTRFSEEMFTVNDEAHVDPSPKGKPTVVVTGFGPFGQHEVNSSWVGVTKMYNNGGLGDDYNLVIEEIPVEYDSVSKIVPRLWKEYKPMLMVHVGLSSITQDLVLEQCAYNHGYVIPDVGGKLPPENSCCKDDYDVLHSEIDMGVISQKIINSNNGTTALVSRNAGRYLCEFIYFTSLSLSKRTVFIHVPALNNPYSDGQLASSLKEIILCLLDELKK